MIYGAGQMESGLLSSPYLIVMAEEIMGMTKRIMRGVEMDEDRLCRGVIDDVQPGGHYLGSPHTRYYFKDEQFWPTLMNRNRIDDWIAAGSRTLGERTTKKTQDLLNFYQGNVLNDDTLAQIKDILAKAEKNM
jgi:trimethylamine--corrinoid protein Co-methyltransferase